MEGEHHQILTAVCDHLDVQVRLMLDLLEITNKMMNGERLSYLYVCVSEAGPQPVPQSLIVKTLTV